MKNRLHSGFFHGKDEIHIMAGRDLTLPVSDGFVNLRVGAIIQKNGAFLMVRNAAHDYYYSVGGRIQFGETAEEAVLREVEEETGCHLEIDRLGFIHEDFFYGDSDSNRGKLVYEISWYYYMRTPEDFEPVCRSVSENNHQEYVEWVYPDCKKQIFPDFFRTELAHPSREIKHIVTDER